MTGDTRNTKSTDAEGSQLSREEIELLPGQEVTDVIEGVKYLEFTLLTVPGIPYTAETMIGALLQISMLPGIKTNYTNVNTIHVAAFILSELNMEKKAQVIPEVIMEKLDVQLVAFNEEASAIMATIEEKTSEVTDTLKEQLTKTANKITEEIKTAMMGINETTKKLAETTSRYRDALTQPVQPMNYKDTLTQPPPHTKHNRHAIHLRSQP
jgi:hypothetical protein